MGNNQSNTRIKRYSTCKIASKLTFSDLTPEMISKNAGIEQVLGETINFYVVNKFGWKYILCPNHSPFSEYQTGDCVEIEDLELNNPGELPRRIENSCVKISDSNKIKIVGKVDSEGKVRDSEGNLLESIGEFFKEYNEANQRHAYMAESARYQNQVVQFQTSWNMPPKW